MGRKHEAAQLLLEGLSPSQIASQMTVLFATVKQYLLLQVGEGAIRRSDILFSLPQNLRDIFDQLPTLFDSHGVDLNSNSARKVLTDAGFSPEEMAFYIELRDAGASRGDMYEDIADIEIALHQFVRYALTAAYGDGETGWWRQGVPIGIRSQCVSSREADPAPADDPFCYTNFIHLAEVIEKSWDCFQKALPASFSSDRRALMRDLRRLNEIRNAVMHPIKRRPWTEQDFRFVNGFSRILKDAVVTPISDDGAGSNRPSELKEV